MTAPPLCARSVHLAHHWFVQRRGGERVFEEIAGLFPEAEISTLFLRRSALGNTLRHRRFRVSTLGRLLPDAWDHRRLLPLFPWAVRGMQVPAETDFLVSSDAALIKGIRKPPGCIHVCYCHSPPRYLWDLAEEYVARTGVLVGWGGTVFRRMVPRLREFDRMAAQDVDHFVANSAFVAGRIRKCYGRDATVIYPPVDIDRFDPHPGPGKFYLWVGEVVSYKRADLAVAACARLGRSLVVVGDGPELNRLRQGAPRCIQFAGRLPDAGVARLMADCRALIHPQIEDFGITAVEAQAAGRPVIAYREGGALETVRDHETGLFFGSQEPGDLQAAIMSFEEREHDWQLDACRRNAERFSRARFRESLAEFLCGVYTLGPTVQGVP